MKILKDIQKTDLKKKVDNREYPESENHNQEIYSSIHFAALVKLCDLKLFLSNCLKLM
jgi:hypothetical protein